MKKQRLCLTEEERSALIDLVSSGCPPWKLRRVQSLLACDESDLGLGWSDAHAAKAYGCSVWSVELWRQTAVTQGIEAALSRKHRSQPMSMHRLTGQDEARLVAEACSAPPAGHSRWTLRLLSKRLVELEIVESVSHETIRRSLKKTNFSPGVR